MHSKRDRHVLSDERFTVEGTPIEAWASLKSFQRKEQEKQENGDEEKDRGNANVNFREEYCVIKRHIKRLRRQVYPDRRTSARLFSSSTAETSS